jgi:hypothetical protein
MVKDQKIRQIGGGEGQSLKGRSSGEEEEEEEEEEGLG